MLDSPLIWRIPHCCKQTALHLSVWSTKTCEIQDPTNEQMMLIMTGSSNLRLKLTSGLNKRRKEDRRAGRKAGRQEGRTNVRKGKKRGRREGGRGKEKMLERKNCATSQ